MSNVLFYRIKTFNTKTCARSTPIGINVPAGSVLAYNGYQGFIDAFPFLLAPFQEPYAGKAAIAFGLHNEKPLLGFHARSASPHTPPDAHQCIHNVCDPLD